MHVEMTITYDSGAYEVEKVMGHREVPRGKEQIRVEYYVKWKGWPIEDATWEPRGHMHRADKVIREYHERTFRSFNKFMYRSNEKLKRGRELEEGDDNSGWRIDKILDHTRMSRVDNKTFMLYLVKWKGYDDLWTWEQKSTVQQYEGGKLLSHYQVAHNLWEDRSYKRKFVDNLKDKDESLKTIRRTSSEGPHRDEILEPMWALLELKMMGNKQFHTPCKSQENSFKF